MSFQFCCPQGHVLQGEPSQVGQVFQCPMCGSNFLIPPPEMGPVAAGGLFPAPGTWPAPQPFAFAPAAVNPPAAGPAAAAGNPTEAPQQTPATGSQNETPRPRFDLGFDPNADESLPFELPGFGDAEGGPAAGFSPAPSFPGGPFSATDFPAPSMPAPTFEPGAGGPDFLQFAPAASEEADAAEKPPKVLHIRCPSGHLVTAKSNLLGKNGRCPACKKTFELRYEDSVEFQRRKENILRREEIKTGRAWIAWAFLAAFLVFAALVAVMLALSR